MRVSRVRLTAGAALLLFLVAPAQAQIGPPVPLLPQPKQAPAAPESAPTSQASPDSTPAEEDIRASPLAPVDPSWIGTLGAADGALPREMWTSTPRSLVAAALPLLRPTTSPVLQDLARRLLLSDAVAPAGQDTADRPGLPELRLNRLLALGRLDGASLIDALPQVNVSENFDRDSVELRFAANDVDGACRFIQQRASRYRNPWWDRAIIACQALSGGYDQAVLGLSAMRERKIPPDPAFEALIDSIAGHRQKLDKLPDPTPMRMVLLAAAKLPLPVEALAVAGPAALATWATSDKVPALQRLAAAERAETFGALPPDALGLVYGSIDAKPEEQATVLTSGKLPEDPRSRAILYSIARANNNATTRVAALTPLLAEARKRGAFIAMARLVAPLISELSPGPETQKFAGDAARVLLVTGHADQALPWVDLAGAAELRIIAALAAPAAGDNIPLPEAMAALAVRDATAAPREAEMLIALLSALGAPPVGFDVAPLMQATHQGMIPGAALWLDQQQAASAGRVGETVLTSLVIATAGDQLSPEPLVVAGVVSGLKTVGLESEARALAVEAAIAAGI